MHDPEDRCFYCMSEAEFHRSSVGKERRTIFMDSPLSECPHADQDMFDTPDSLGAVTPAAAEGGAHPGSSEPPHAVEPGAPQPDTTMAPIDAEVALRWRDALRVLASNPCSNGDAAFSCPDMPIERAEWCSYCIAYDALNPRGEGKR